MDAADFHRRLLGIPPSDHHRSFYESTARGFNRNNFDDNDFLATFVKALALSHKGPVVIVTTKALEKVVIEAIKAKFRMVVRRYKSKEDRVKDLTNHIKRLRLATRYLREDEEPDHWVSVGLGSTDPIPSWLRTKLWPTKS